jgi:hypothetical protein
VGRWHGWSLTRRTASASGGMVIKCACTPEYVHGCWVCSLGGGTWKGTQFPSFQSIDLHTTTTICPPSPPLPADFRKDYTKLSFFKQRYPRVPLMALTATATPRVQHDIVASLGINTCLVFKSSFNRPNLR